MTQPRLTKTRFKTGLKCPRKLSYSNNPNLYANSQVDDPFLKALAKGGFQVNAYLKETLKLKYDYIKTNHTVASEEENIALKETMQYLELDQVIIFEAAFLYQNCFIRCDAIVKDGNTIHLYEAKSKAMRESYFEDIVYDVAKYEEYIVEKWNTRKTSYDGILNKTKAFSSRNYARTNSDSQAVIHRSDILREKFYVNSEWEETAFDIAFQYYVVKNVYPQFDIVPYLCGPDQDKTATVNGLNQKFFIREVEDGIVTILRGKMNKKHLGNDILSYNDVTWLCIAIVKDHLGNIESFKKTVKNLSDICQFNLMGDSRVGSICRGCQFNANETHKLNGFSQCLSEKLDTEIDPKESNIFNLWNNRKFSTFLDNENKEDNVFYLKDIEAQKVSNRVQQPLAQSERQDVQINLANKSNKEFLRKQGLKKSLEELTYPIHFIDFETATSAIPYRKGQSPYETIAFQFSHHILHSDGTVKHATQYINLEPFENPNIEFVKRLYEALKNDDGSIMMWSKHERTVLRHIARELVDMDKEDCPEKNELLDFIVSLDRGGSRELVDMWDIYKAFHYLPQTNGSNSIKYVLPAVLEKFKSLEPILSDENNYGIGKDKIFSSLNFKKKAWLQRDKLGKLKDPYSLLDKVYKELDDKELDLLYGDDTLNNGGSAMVAYAMCQFTQISNGERGRLKRALLRYCELDTFAMVIIFFYWLDQLKMFSSDATFKETMNKRKKELMVA